MESHEVLKRAFDSPRTSPKQIAAEMGVSLSLVYKWAQPDGDPGGPPGSGSKNPLDRVAELIDLTRDPAIIEWLCQRANGYFVRNPRGPGGRAYDVVPATHEIVQQFAGLLSVISQAAIDNSITEAESAQIRKVWDGLKSFCEGFVRCCEEGDFQPIQKELIHRR